MFTCLVSVTFSEFTIGVSWDDTFNDLSHTTEEDVAARPPILHDKAV